jgi:uncharacterized repeat protein (TIGR02543 family)
LQKLKNRKSISTFAVVAALLLSITAPAFGAPVKKTPIQLKSPTSIVVTPLAPGGDFKVEWTGVSGEASSYTVYTVSVYDAGGRLPQGSKFESATSGIKFTKSPNTTYRVTVQAISTNTSLYANSPESGKYSVTTYQSTYATTWNDNCPPSGSGTCTLANSGGASTYTTGSTVSIPTTAPTADGYTFNSWNTAADGSGATVNNSYAPGPSYGNKNFYAKWAAVNIIWNHNGGASVTPGPSAYTEGSSIGSLPATTKKAGYTFSGWFVDPTFITGSAIDNTYVPSPFGLVTFYAKWTPIRPVCGNNGLRSSGGSGPCQVGDIGPGGGIIFLLPSSQYNSTGKYFEFAGANAGSGRYGLCSADIWVGTSWAVGQGKNNTDLLLANSLCSAPSYLASAASAASNYTSNGFNDWYLPSFEELVQAKLNLATSVAEAALLGINVSDSQKYVGDYDYLASSEYSANSSAWVDFGIYTQSQSSLFNCGNNWVDPPVSGWPRCSDYKPGTHFVRAVRSAYFTNASYAIGDPGPGGGTIYYYDSVGFNCGATFSPTGSPTNGLCHYLEVAPNEWVGAGLSDPQITWATNVNNNQSTIVTGAVGTDIGTGLQNSINIEAQTGNVAGTSAAVAARAYNGGSKSDWYLPSKDELNELCKYASNQTTGNTTVICSAGVPFKAGFTVDPDPNYWSSSQDTTNHAQALYQWFENGTMPLSAGKNNPSIFVRPIRAF